MKFFCLLSLTVLTGCASRPAPAVVPRVSTAAEAAVEQLRTLPGTFEYIDAERTGWFFRGDEIVLLRIAEADSLIVPTLIDCIGRTEPATAKLDGQRVPLGIMCWVVFGRTKYYGGHSRIATLPLEYRDRPMIRLNATPDQLRALGAWWRNYWNAGSPLLPSQRPPSEEL